MNSERVDFWTQALWRHYAPQILSGAPFYLAADSNLIFEVMQENEQASATITDTVDDFHNACRTVFEVTATRAKVRQAAFQKVQGHNYSRAICLAVQQVLIVELMLHDKNYSEHSYFPRYRHMLGIAQGPQHTNPLGASFERIWNTLEAELLIMPGGNRSSITFFRGRGRNLNSNFPLSQALFTSHDLELIRDKAMWLDECSDDMSIIRTLYQLRRYLGRRAQNLINKATVTQEMRSRVSKQVKSFMQLRLPPSATATVTAQSRPPAEINEIVAYVDGSDLFQDIFTVFVRTTDGKQQSGPLLTETLSKRLHKRRTILLIARDDCYLELSSRTVFTAGATIIAIMEQALQEQFLSDFQHLYGVIPSLYPSNLPESHVLIFCSSVPDDRLFGSLGIEASSDGDVRIQLVGGLFADATTRTFLQGYGPTAIKHRSNEIVGASLILVNGVLSRADEFLRELSLREEFAAYQIEIDGDRLQFSIAATKADNAITPVFGFALNGAELTPVAVEMLQAQPGLRGVVLNETLSEEHSHTQITLTANDLLTLLRRGPRIALPRAILRSVLQVISAQSNTSPLSSLVSQQIERSGGVPIVAVTSGLIKRITEHQPTITG